MATGPATAERPEAPLFADGLGERVVAVDAATGDLLQILRVRPQLLAVPSFEFALRERAARLANFRHAYYARVRRIDRHPGGLAIVSDHVEGVRLSEMLRVAHARGLRLDLSAALCLVRQLVPSLALLHENARDVAHGLVAPERLIVTPRARLIVVEHVLGSAVEQLQFKRERLWHELRVAVPASAGAIRFDHRADVTAIGVTALSLVLGRPLNDDEYPQKTAALLAEARERASAVDDQPLPDPLHTWIARALHLDGRQGFTSASEAQLALEDALTEDAGFVAAPVALETFLSRYIAAMLDPVPAVPPVAAKPPVAVTSTAASTSAPASPIASVDRPASPIASVDRSASPVASVDRPASPIASVDRSASPIASVDRSASPIASVDRPASPIGPVEKPVTPPAPKPVFAAAPPISVITPPAAVPVAPPASVASPAAAAPAPSAPVVPAAPVAFVAPAAPAALVAPVAPAAPVAAPAPGLSAPPAPPAPAPSAPAPSAPAPSAPAPSARVAPPAPAQSAPLAPPAPPAPAPRDITELLKDFDLPPLPGSADTARVSTPDAETRDEVPVRSRSRFGGWRRIAMIAFALVAIGEGGLIAARAYKKAPPPALGTLSVQTNPPGVAVFVDGVARGNTPARVSLDAGSHILELRGRGVPRVIPVTITGGAEASQYLELPQTPSTGSLLVQSEPAGAHVTIDGADHGIAPVSVADLAPGEHEVVLQAEGGQPVRQKVVIQAGVTASILAPVTTAAPGPVSGWLSLKSPVTVEIRENGRLIGTSDTDKIMMAAGRHDIELVNDTLGYHATRSIQVPPGKVAPVALELPQGTININAAPWADVFIDGRHVGETPIGNLSLAIGPHEILFRHPQLGEKREAVSVTLNAPVRVSVSMK